jgi:hypothetical protein
MVWPPVSHGDVKEEINNLRAVSPAVRSGFYYYPAGQNSITTLATLGVGTLRIAPAVIPRAITIDRLGAEITAVGEAGSKLRIGIYADDGTGKPGSLLLDAGQINGDSATVQEITVNQTLNPGIYWFGAVVQAVTTTQPTVRIIANWTPPILMGISTSLPGAGATVLGLSMSGVTGALPGTFSTTPGSSASIPRLFYRIAP